jgi:methylamine dehydrogenase accessory protein MauD
MDWIALLARLMLAAVFLIAAVGKLADRQGSRQALADFGVPSRMAAPVALILPLVEFAIAALLIPSASTRWGALAALGLLGLFIAGISVSLAHGRKPDCHCFGQLHSAPIGWSTLVRNGFLAAVAGIVLWQGGESPDFASLAAGAGLSVAVWIALAVALIALTLAAIEAWLLLNLLTQQGRILVRLERLESALGLGSGTGLPMGEQAPEFKLPSLTGERLSLAGLRSSGQPVLLFFANPNCAPCDALLPEIARWQREHADRVTVAVISDGPMEVNRAKAEKHGVATVLLQKDREVKEAYDVTATPAAILVGADGRISSRIGYGADGVEGLLQQVLTGVAYAPLEPLPASTNGHHLTPEPPVRNMTIGQCAPALALPDLEGKTIDLAGFEGSSTLVLFWRPSCGFCQQMLPELKKWERKRPPGSPRLLVVSTGAVEENRAMGFTSPVVLDAEGAAMRSFGATGTPMAVLVDAEGRVASSLMVGAAAVMALARTRQNEPVGKLRQT